MITPDVLFHLREREVPLSSKMRAKNRYRMADDFVRHLEEHVDPSADWKEQTVLIAEEYRDRLAPSLGEINLKAIDLEDELLVLLLYPNGRRVLSVSVRP